MRSSDYRRYPVGARWQRLMLTGSDITEILPAGWTNDITETAGPTGETNLNVTATVAATLPADGLILYKDTGYLASDDFNISFFIDLVDATSGGGGYGSAQADGFFLWVGLSSDPNALATEGGFIGYEHDSVAQPRAMTNRAGANTFATASNSTRHVKGIITSGKNHVSDGGRVASLDFNEIPLNFAANLSNLTTPGATTDPIYITVALGRDAAGSYNIPVRIWYCLEPKFTF